MLIGGELVAGDGDAIAVENPFTEETFAEVGAALRASRSTRRSRPPPRPRAGWERTPAVERGEMLHEVANRLRERTDELAETMTREGGKPLDREPRRGRLDRGGVRLLRRDRPRLGRPRDPADRGDPARDGGQGPGRRRRLHRALELPAAAARVEARAGARRRQPDGLQALRADPALDPRARALLRAPARRRRQPRRRRRRRWRRDRRRRAGRLRRLHRLGRDRQEGRR